MGEFEQGDRIEATNGATGSKRRGRVIRSREFRDWRGDLIHAELLHVIWDDGTVERSLMTEGVTRVHE